MAEIINSLRSSLSHPSVLMFGPISISCNPTQVSRVRKAVISNNHNAWILSLAAQLPQLWTTISTALPTLYDDSGYKQILDMAEALRLGRPLKTPYPLPNKVLIPLVVIYHLTQYTDFIQRAGVNVDEALKNHQETLGFCTGLLSAFAVSASGNTEDFERYGAVAIRLGMLVGMVVDAREAPSDLNVSKSVRAGWGSTQTKEELKSIINEFSNTYVSVEYDENIATITTEASTIRALDQRLKNAGFISTELELYGRFHSDCHQTLMASILEFCDATPEFQFPDASKILIPTRSDTQGELFTQGKLHHHALESILTKICVWHQTLAGARQSLADKNSTFVSFGFTRFVPPTYMRAIGSQVIHWADMEDSTAHALKDQRAIRDNDIAVVGMSCKVAGADNLEEFWDLLCAAKSQHREVPPDRIAFNKTAFRDIDEKRKWFANLIDGPDKFDHKFFKKSPRESATMDPQQRLLLQTAYQAVEHSGYFRSPEPDKRVGCYIGLCATDYENNIACHAPNAFSATGNLQGFVAGKVSHYFGWTGPGLTIDTACSSSAVAVHQACRAIISGECTAALAGGTHVMTSPLWFQNLAGASFLSTTGQCKPFDAKADGYCRGEGVGVVFLKKLSAAVADGDQILGVVAGTGVQQNQNCTPIFVPNVPSLSNLFSEVTKTARLTPDQISVVEAHGTGTAVGDPAEYDSIRQVLGGAVRSSPLVISSVKGLVGHIECTSGIISMIKVLLMMNKGAIPAQASFTTINPAIKATPADNMTVPTSLLPWDVKFRAALINNYGASGSNASLVITESPLAARYKVQTGALPQSQSSGLKYPLWLCGLDDQSLRRYTKALTAFLNKPLEEDLSIANIAYNVARQTNRGLEQRLVFTAESVSDLQQKLTAFQNGSDSIASMERVTPRPVILCFGGQVSKFVGLDRHLYESIPLLRKHLDDVDATVRSLGVDSIFPAIFERSPITSIVKLQTALFASQYACARSWIDSGVQPSAVIGHSFGELTALCISQVLSVKDTLKMIVSRATLIQDAWGPEKGAMMAIEGELSAVERLLTDVATTSPDSSKAASIACYNGPRSFTLAGSEAAIDAVGDAVAKLPKTTNTIRVKKLNVTNAFHCALVDPLVNRLEENAEDLAFREPKIPIERVTESPMQGKFTAKFVSEHMRQPVFFNHALQRLAQRHPNAIFLEAGSSSTITSMASKALDNLKTSHFQAVNITNDNGWNNLVDATTGLWRAGLPAQFWAHCATQSTEHTPLLLPPYQFDDSRHWLELKAPSQTTVVMEAPKIEAAVEKLPDTLLTFVGYQDREDRLARFRVNTMIPLYAKYVAGHIVAQTAAICPSIVQLDLVIEAVRSIHSDIEAASLQPQVHLVENQSPLCINAARQVFIETEESTQGTEKSWSFQIFSTDGTGGSAKTMHTTGRLEFRAADDVSLKLEFARLERFMNHRRYLEMMSSGDVDEILSHRNIYNIFSEIVEYSDEYRGLQKLVAHGSYSAGYVTRKTKTSPGSVDAAFMTESVCQVGGIYVNCMTGRSPSDIFLATGIERWIRSPKVQQGDTQPEAYHVLASHHQSSDKTFLTDVFVYDVNDGSLVEAILGVSFVKVAKLTMQKLLTRLTPGIGPKSSVSNVSAPDLSLAVESLAGKPLQSTPTPVALQMPTLSKAKKGPPKPDVAGKVKEILAELSGLEMHEIKPDSMLPDLGIDSLMGMEMAHEIEAAFKITLPEDELMEIIDMPGLIKCVQKAVGVASGAVDDGDYMSDGEESSSGKSDDRQSVTSSSHGPSTGRTTPREEAELDLGSGELKLSFATVMEAFNETKALTDERIAEYGQTDYVDTVMPLQTKMCIALTLEALEELGVALRDAAANQKFLLISHPKEHSRLVEYLYKMLAEAQLVIVDDTHITRTGVPYPTASSKQVLEELLQRFPDQNTADKLTFYTGSNLAEVLRGKTDGIKLVFGTPEGRELVSGLYGEWPLNRIFYRQMEDFLGRLASKLHGADGPLKILEMGAGTGGTTRWLVPLLATLNVPVEYTFTDLAPSFVAAARKKFKPYPFMKFRTHDIEKAPTADLEGTQHIIIASNAVHATHSLCGSTANMRKLLRPDGFLMMLEMTGTLYWVDMIFGLFEGWWFFDDGRTHAVADELRWKKDLQSVGYGHVDWTDGQRPENKKEKLIIAMASGPRCERLDTPLPVSSNRRADLVVRQAVIDQYVRQFTHGFDDMLEESSADCTAMNGSSNSGFYVVVTGATGSLGSHLVATLASRTNVAGVICLNRRSKLEISAMDRQLQSLSQRGITLPQSTLDKLHVFESDLSKSRLGLSDTEYNFILTNASHIIHNAWLMNAKWPVKRFEPQLQIMRNLLDVAGQVSSRQPKGQKFTFQFVSSIATVGHWPIWTGNPCVPEDRMTLESVLPTGYGDAKYICELMLDATLHRYPDRFRAMVVRPGQIAGSSTSGYWNPMEHLSFLFKSSQTLAALPDLRGPLSWTPVDTVAATLVDLVSADQPYAVYHIDNPIRQPWEETLSILADAMDIPQDNVIPLQDWIQRVKERTKDIGAREHEGDNPAILLIDFLEDNFVRMSCGGLLLDTAKTREHSPALAGCGPVGEDVARLYVRSWKETGFLR